MEKTGKLITRIVSIRRYEDSVESDTPHHE